MRACARAAVQRATEYKTIATEYNEIAFRQASEGEVVWATSMAACASAPRFTVVRALAATLSQAAKHALSTCKPSFLEAAALACASARQGCVTTILFGGV